MKPARVDWRRYIQSVASVPPPASPRPPWLGPRRLSQPTIAAYEADRKAPSFTTIERLAQAVGLEATVSFHPQMTREDRRSLALHQAIADRFVDQPEVALHRARETLAGMLRHAPTSPALQEWRVLLTRPVSALAELLVDPGPWARELRHVTPFAGVLSAAERAIVYRRFGEAEERRRRHVARIETPSRSRNPAARRAGPGGLTA